LRSGGMQTTNYSQLLWCVMKLHNFPCLCSLCCALCCTL
jgi:hypothetical protein